MEGFLFQATFTNTQTGGSFRRGMVIVPIGEHDVSLNLELDEYRKIWRKAFEQFIFLTQDVTSLNGIECMGIVDVQSFGGYGS